MNKLILLSVLFIFCSTNLVIAQNKNNISVDTFQKKIDSDDYIILDVRTFEEYSDGHIDQALNIDYFSSTFRDDLVKLGVEKPVLVYCRSGNRSEKSMDIMYELGFKEVKNLIGGYKSWILEKNSVIIE